MIRPMVAMSYNIKCDEGITLGDVGRLVREFLEDDGGFKIWDFAGFGEVSRLTLE